MEFLYQSIFKSWKTTLAGLVGGVVWLAAQYGVVITPEVADGVIVVALFIIGLLSKDSTASHTQED